MRIRLVFLGLISVLVLVVLIGCQAGGEQKQKALVDHPALLERHSLDCQYPRFSAEQLSLAGYPDHMHAFACLGWQPLVDEHGVPYGPGSLCAKHEVVPREGLLVEPGLIRYQSFHLEFDSRYHICDMMPFVELMDWARNDLQDMLGLVRQDTLFIDNPNSTVDYQQQSGLGTWRMYKLIEDHCVVQAIAVLYARTLPGHAAFELVTQWTLRGVVGNQLPLWFEWGLMQYLAETGCHLANYMGPYRAAGPVLLTPERVNQIMAAEPNPDQGQDTQNYRKACYSAFIMVWNLIENRGGLSAMRDFFAEVSGGQTVDQAARKIWRADMAQLSQQLDATQLGEPLGDTPKPLAPHKPPQPPAETAPAADAATSG